MDTDFRLGIQDQNSPRKNAKDRRGVLLLCVIPGEAQLIATAVSGEIQGCRTTGNKKPAIEANPIGFVPNSIDLEAKSIHFMAKSIYLEAKSIYFEAKSVHLEAKSVHLEAKSIYFEAKSVHLEAKSVHLEAKSIDFAAL